MNYESQKRPIDDPTEAEKTLEQLLEKDGSEILNVVIEVGPLEDFSAAKV